MPQPSLGNELRRQAWSLISVLMEQQRQGNKDVQLRRDREGRSYLSVQAKLSNIEAWAKESLSNKDKDMADKFSISKVRELLTQQFGTKFLNIVNDKSKKKAGRGSENWHFELGLLTDDEEEFKRIWDNVKQNNKKICNSSQRSKSNHQILSKDRIDVLFVYNERDKNTVEKIEKIEEKLKREGIKVMMSATCRLYNQPYETWEKQAIAQPNSVAVFVSSDGRGPWEDEKLASLLTKYYNKRKKYNIRKRNFISVLLQNAPSNSFEQENVLAFLKGDNNPINFTQGDFTENVEQLILAIKGEEYSSRKRNFLALFSHSNKDINRKCISILVPKYLIEKKLKVENQLKNNTAKPSRKEAATINLSQSDTYTSIWNDTQAYIMLDSLFQKPLPELRHMSDKENINFEDEKKETFILIGLSNDQDVLDKNGIPGKYFDIDFKTENRYRFFFRCGRIDDSGKVCTPSRWESYEENQDSEYDDALFAKFIFGSKTIIFCGGVTETSTNRVAWYLKYHWQELYNQLRDRKGEILNADDPFAVAIRTPKNKVLDDELDFLHFKIEQICIEKNT